MFKYRGGEPGTLGVHQPVTKLTHPQEQFMRTVLKKTGQEERVCRAQEVEGLTSGSNPGKGRKMGWRQAQRHS